MSINYFSCLLVGPPGSGKTTAAATAPGPVLFLDCDNKLHKMYNLKEQLAKGEVIQWAVNEPLADISLMSLARQDVKPGAKATTKRPMGYEQLAGYIDKLSESGCIIEHMGKKVKVESVVLDTFTSMSEHLKRLLMSANGTTTMTMPLYGTALSNYEILINTLMRLKANILVLAHEKVDKDELTGKISYTPLIDGQMKDKIGKDFEEVYFLEKNIIGGNVKYEMLTVGDSAKACRTSRPLAAKIEPNFQKVYGVIQ